MVIKTTRWSPDTCGCEIEYTFDDTISEDTRVHTLDQVVKRCPAHIGLNTHTAIYDAVKTENEQIKNPFFNHLLENAPATMVDIDGQGQRKFKNGIDVNWVWSGIAPNRILNATVTGISLTAIQKNAITTLINNKVGVGKVLITFG